MPILQGDVYPAGYSAGKPLAGATVVLTVTAPDGSISTPATTVNTAAGTATATVPAPLAGTYLMVWAVSGTVVDVEVDQFTAHTPVLELVSLTDARELLRIQPTDRSDDQRIRAWIRAAAHVVEHVTGPIRGQARTDWFDGGGTFVVLPFQWVKGITAVAEVRGITTYPLTEQPLGATVSDFGYTWDRTINKLVRRDAGGAATRFPNGEQVIRVDYSLGFATVPTDIQMAAAELVAHWYQRAKPGRASGYRASDPAPEETAVGNYLVPNAVMELLEPWRRRPGIF